MPKNFDTDMVSKKHPVSYNESMNTVLQQELIRFNKLITVVRNSLIDVGKAIDGLLVFSSDLEKVYGAIFDNKIPEIWKKVSYPSLKPLGSYMNDLIERLSFMQKWIEKGAPPTFWVSGFYFTQSFLTGVMQNYSRKYSIPIDTLVFEFKVIDPDKHLHIDLTISPADGCYIYGLFFDGARWDKSLECINESIPKQLNSEVPYIQLIPTDKKIEYTDQHKVYCCPVYKTSDRRGVLSTTGHSTNFVLDIFFPIHKETTSDHWVKRGLAALT